MHTIHNALKIAIIVGNLLVPFTTFSMRPNQNQQAECSICGEKRIRQKQKGLTKQQSDGKGNEPIIWAPSLSITT